MAYKSSPLRFMMSFSSMGMRSLLFILLVSSTTGEDQSCEKVVPLDKPIKSVGAEDHHTPETGCPQEHPGECLLIYRGKSDIIRITTKLCAEGGYNANCDYDDQIFIFSSTANYTLPCEAASRNKSVYANVCAPIGGDLNMTFKSHDLCGHASGSEARHAPLGLEVKQISQYKNPVFLTKTHQCRGSVSSANYTEGTILSGEAPGDPKMEYCAANIYVKTQGHNKMCLTFVEFTTYNNGPTLKIARKDEEDLVYSDANPIPKTKKVCLPLLDNGYPVVFSVEHNETDTTKNHKFIIKYETMKDPGNDASSLSSQLALFLALLVTAFGNRA